ncbi:MAG: type II toxin-antitoxin system RelE/ParE family toxin [Oscillospiraceae bacterium]|nr:type II toxin-antitoxin system RelE/ParE family toxin [Oscillospiraceae bacterium]
MHKVVYLPLAESDLLEALNYIMYTLDAPKAARDLLTEFDETVQRIAGFPYACELYRTDRPMKDEIRKVPVKNYVLYYAVYQDRVEIRRFLHGRRDRSKGIAE